MSSGFVHLHVHSQFSFMDGAASLPGLVERAVELEMPALALTDHQGLSGAIRFYKECHAAGIKPIVGCEVVVETAGISSSTARSTSPGSEAAPSMKLNCECTCRCTNPEDIACRR